MKKNKNLWIIDVTHIHFQEDHELIFLSSLKQITRICSEIKKPISFIRFELEIFSN